MSKNIIVRFLSDEWLPVTRDGLDYRLHYSLVESQLVGKPEEEFHTQKGHIVVGISRSLCSMWDLNKNDLRKVLFEFGKRHIEEMISEGALSDRTELQLTTANAPKKSFFDPKLIDITFDKPFKFQPPSENPLASAEPSSLAFQIVDIRDSINAIFGERFGGRLLTLPQERHLIELFKRCTTQEEFAYRVASLGGLATAIDPVSLKKTTVLKGNKIKKEPKPLDLLGTFLRNRYHKDKVNVVMDALEGFNHLRRMYPIHSDRTKGVLSAHQFFNLDYPVSDHQRAWETLLEKYREILEMLLQLLKSNSSSKNVI